MILRMTQQNNDAEPDGSDERGSYNCEDYNDYE